MTTPKLTGRKHRRHPPGSVEATKARLFLALACLWPLCLLALFSASAPHVEHSSGRQLGVQFRNVLDRVDIMGYGPTHPRLAVSETRTQTMLFVCKENRAVSYHIKARRG